uniref:Uncharacterized protein n=1 Tax=Oryza meridionalis TaxID=40149 RepID=A0A0E0C985_9ORYZ
MCSAPETQRCSLLPGGCWATAVTSRKPPDCPPHTLPTAPFLLPPSSLLPSPFSLLPIHSQPIRNKTEPIVETMIRGWTKSKSRASAPLQDCSHSRGPSGAAAVARGS